MITYTCRCGEAVVYGSYPPSPCTSCDVCGSGLSIPGFHGDPEPHKFATWYDNKTGEPFEICEVCYRTKSELEKKS